MEADKSSSEAQKYKSSTKKILLLLALIYFGLVSAVVYYAYTTSPDPCGDGVCSKDENCTSCQRDCSCDPPKKITTTTTRFTPSTTLPSTTCRDSDGGLDYYEKGTTSGDYVIDHQFRTYVDECQNEEQLNEGFCNQFGDVSMRAYLCPYGCEDGVCVFKHCIETDDGADIFVAGTTTENNIYEGGNMQGTNYSDSCVGEKKVREFFCLDERGPLTASEFNCENGCVNGACITDTSQNATSNSRVNRSCVDSDEGIDYYTKGTVVWGLGGGRYYNASDECFDKTILSEVYCYDDKTFLVQYATCLNGCVDGACRKENASGSLQNNSVDFEQSTDNIVDYAISHGEKHAAGYYEDGISYNGAYYMFDFVSGYDYYHATVVSYGGNDIKDITLIHSTGSADLTDKERLGDVTTRYVNLLAGRDSDVKESEYFYYQKGSEKLGTYQLFSCVGVANCDYDRGVINKTLVDERPNPIQNPDITRKFSDLLKTMENWIKS